MSVFLLTFSYVLPLMLLTSQVKCVEESNFNMTSVAMNTTASSTTSTCPPGQYTCWNGKCISGQAFCDDKVDCDDKTDELDYDRLMQQVFNLRVRQSILPCVTPSAWQLYGDQARPCALRHTWICDGVYNQCKGDIDEDCWRAPSNECAPISSKLRCDGYRDCPDGSDEANCTTCASSVGFSLGYSGKVHESKLCDDQLDCAQYDQYDWSDECIVGCKDECYCAKIYELDETKALREVENPEQCMWCLDRSSMYKFSKLCDGHYDCADKTDEINCFDFKCDNGKVIKEALRCDTRDDCGDSSDECTCEHTFKCNNSRCIFEGATCNGVNECGDHSDECLSTCGAGNKFMCKNGECISALAFCDGVVDCTDGSDEIVTTVHDITSTSVLCNNVRNFENKTCLLEQKPWMCDMVDDCVDRSDECHRECSAHSFWCDDGKCLKVEAFCDGKPDCQDGTDEIPYDDGAGNVSDDVIPCVSNRWTQKKCALNITHPWICDVFTHCVNRTDECTAQCSSSYVCGSGECIDRAWLCDGDIDCSDQSDENATTGKVFECVRTRHTVTRSCFLPLSITTDNVSDCDRNMDVVCLNREMENESYETQSQEALETLQTIPTTFQCIGERLTIPGEMRCDGIFDCLLLSDECLCENSPSVCDSVCYSSSFPPDGANNPCALCSLGELECGGKCISRKEVCDKTVDCDNGMDEKFCKNQSRCSSNRDVEGNCFPEFHCLAEETAKMYKAHECDGQPQCTQFEDECSDSCSKRNSSLPSYCGRLSILSRIGNYYGCNGGGKYLKGPQVCDGLSRECLGGEDELDCPGRIYCNGSSWYGDHHNKRGAIHIDPSQICDWKIDCSDKGDESNCPHRYYCESGRPFFVPMVSVMDGKDDCMDGSDECPQERFNESVFSSRELMIRDPFLQYLIWVMGSLSIVGNLAVLIETVHDLSSYARLFKSKRAFAKVNHVLVVNLALADLLMGVYLLILGSEAAAKSGSYCLDDKSWRSSRTCDFLGVLTVVSSVTSVLVLVILTSYRVYGVTKPFKCRDVSYFTALGFAGLAWTAAFILALLPVTAFSYHYKSHAWIKHNPYFSSDVVSRKDLVNFIRKLPLFYGHDAANTTFSLTEKNDDSWNSINTALTPVCGDHAIKGLFGYYSTVSVCMPKIYVTPDDVAWEHSLVLIVFHCLAFLYVIGAYVYIFFTTNKAVAVKRSSRHRSMFRRISYIVVSDLACWLPISVMAFANFAGLKIPENAYAVSAVVLLPINSALNPLLYSNTVQRCFLKLLTCGKRGSERWTTSVRYPESRDKYFTKETVAMHCQAKDTRKKQIVAHSKIKYYDVPTTRSDLLELHACIPDVIPETFLESGKQVVKVKLVNSMASSHL